MTCANAEDKPNGKRRAAGVSPFLMEELFSSCTPQAVVRTVYRENGLRAIDQPAPAL